MLGQYGSDGEVGGVSGDIEMASGVGDLEDRGRGDGLLDGDNMAEVFDARSGKRTFAELGIEFLLSEDCEDLAEVLKVVLEGGAEDKDVIKVDNDTDFEEVAEDVVHGGLEGSGGIGSDGGGVFGGDVVEKSGAGGAGGGQVVGVEESIVVEHAREEVSKGHVGFVGEGGCKVFVAYSFDAGDERTVGNDGVGEVVSEGADVLDEAVCGTGLAEVAELFKVVVNGILGAEGGSQEGGPLEEGGAWSSGGSAVASFSHPPFGCIAEEAGGGNGEPVGKGHVVELKRVLKQDAPDEGGGGGNGTMVGIEGLVDKAVEVVGVEEVGGGVLLEAAVEEGVVCAVGVGMVCTVGVGVVCAAVTTVMEGVVPSSVVTRSHMDDMLAFMSSREAVTKVRRVLSAWRMAERSRVAVFVGGCSPTRLRAMLSTESVQMSDMLMEDAAMSGEEGVDDVA
ncbi:hypothetical protein CBR_g8041 [Chara braunii]|uniref:Uncharacterized protein n=1 Tax=Chara braunii TaxID=69332 RepID=A0A388KL19_CHABU|nr:hypothetical protein CBR_g8041 [Chara braunii]|eukprot:GBG70744.1 hypothetical protein CBR_g8041 [Chara braunii]